MDDKLTLNEALTALLVDRASSMGGVDGTNAIALLRNAKRIIEQDVMNYGPDLGRDPLNVPLAPDHVDSIIISASRNGALDIFEM